MSEASEGNAGRQLYPEQSLGVKEQGVHPFLRKSDATERRTRTTFFPGSYTIKDMCFW